MKDDLVEQCARAILREVEANKSAFPDNRDIANAVLAIARPAILEEAVAVVKSHRPSWMSPNTAHLQQQADSIIEAIRALATTGQEGGR